MSIDWANIPWRSLGLLVALTFIASLIGQAIAGENPFVGAFLSGTIFGAIYIGWNHYPHGLLPGIRFPG